jgi:Flp pilus assembly protein TadB
VTETLDRTERTTARTGHRAAAAEQPVGELVKQATEQMSDLFRSELRLAQAEMMAKGKRYRTGGGLFGGAALVGFLGLQAAVATVIAAIAVSLPVWAAALIVAGALFVTAGILALLGRAQTHRAGPLKPEQAINGVKADVEVIRKRAHHEQHS